MGSSLELFVPSVRWTLAYITVWNQPPGGIQACLWSRLCQNKDMVVTTEGLWGFPAVPP